MTTRQRKVEFMASIGPYELQRAAERMVARYGARWLSDEQLDDIVSGAVAILRDRQHRNMRNRAIAARSGQ